jgi:tetratricopeptide (TPR) repeat protein
LAAEERGPVLLPGSLSKSFKDSDARWAIYFPEALKALVLYSRKDYRGAANTYGEIIPKFQEYVYVPTLYGCEGFSQYNELWGQVLNAQDKYRQTVRNLPKARVIDPDFSSISLSRAYAALGDFSSAINEYDRYSTLFPDDTSALLDLGELYIRLEEYQQADQLLKKALAMSPNDSRGHFLYGRTLLLEGRESDARRELDKAAKLDPNGRIGQFARDILNKLR